MSGLRKIGLIFGLLGILAISLWLVIIFYLFNFSPLIKSGDAMTTIVPSSTGTNRLMSQLHKQKLITYPLLWQPFVFVRTYTRRLRMGEYEIQRGMTLAQLLRRIVKGRVYVRHITIPEGWSYRKLVRLLAANSYLKHNICQLDDRQLLQKLGSSQLKPEGLFYPDTYYYTWGDSDIDILQQAYIKMKHVLAYAWRRRQSGLVYKNAYEALIVASLIEKESAVYNERPVIASVIINRLREKIRLQIDPTVIYALGDRYEDRLTRQDLKTPSPFNTYMHKGLPPTPIALPSKSSIHAALHPAHTHYKYYVARGDGSHKFSVTYRQHLQAVKKYLHKPVAHDKDTVREKRVLWIFYSYVFKLFIPSSIWY